MSWLDYYRFKIIWLKILLEGRNAKFPDQFDCCYREKQIRFEHSTRKDNNMGRAKTNIQLIQMALAKI